MIFGRKRRAPTNIAAVEARRTEAAATSFATFASGLTSGLTMFTIDSREVLISSRTKTNMMVMIKIAHSLNSSLSTNPSAIAKMPEIN